MTPLHRVGGFANAEGFQVNHASLQITLAATETRTKTIGTSCTIIAYYRLLVSYC